jgi:hypothetical protein
MYLIQTTCPSLTEDQQGLRSVWGTPDSLGTSAIGLLLPWYVCSSTAYLPLLLE